MEEKNTDNVSGRERDLSEHLKLEEEDKKYDPMRKRIALAVSIFSVLLLIGSIFYRAIFMPSTHFPSGTFVVVSSGETVSSLANDLKKKNVIKSAFVFKKMVSVLGGEIKAGTYYLPTPQSSFKIARRTSLGDYELSSVKITLPEGLNKFEIADILEPKIAEFDRQEFLDKAPEGYMFPDTYYFLPTMSIDSIIKTMRDNFDRKTLPLKEEIKKFGKSEEDVIKMASIIEEEVRTPETKRIISGILWNRIERGMLLQVDVSFKYINGKNSSNLTMADLGIDSPYNTYKYKGLPPTPITNPGLESILSAIEPAKTKYLFFLSDKDGVMHYAVNFDEHKLNKEKYLR